MEEVNRGEWGVGVLTRRLPSPRRVFLVVLRSHVRRHVRDVQHLQMLTRGPTPARHAGPGLLAPGSGYWFPILLLVRVPSSGPGTLRGL